MTRYLAVLCLDSRKSKGLVVSKPMLPRTASLRQLKVVAKELRNRNKSFPLVMITSVLLELPVQLLVAIRVCRCYNVRSVRATMWTDRSLVDEN